MMIQKKFKYDGGGNILRKKEYEITNIGSSGTLLKTYEYGYSSTHKDRLISFNGQSISYNSSGYPTSYKGKTLTWYATVLKKYGTTEYEYTADKVRYKKKLSDGTAHTYYYEGTRLIGEKVVKTDGTEYTLEYFYDERGIMGVRHNKTPYIFVKNIQGDIVAIYDLFGKVAEYVYDAWGNCTVAYSGNEIAEINPFRYRGYYYDTDSKLYYLITRYYDPETGRFISPDGIEYLAPEQLNGLNLYAYCNNNPVMNIDPDGTWSWKKILAGIAVAALVLVAIVATAGVATVPVTMTGASIAVTALEITAATATGAAVSGMISISTQSDEDFSFKQFGIDVGVGAVSGMFTYGTGKLLGYIGEEFGYALSNSYFNSYKIGNVFSGEVLGDFGKIIGGAIGGIGGGTFFDEAINNLIGSNNSLQQRLGNNIFGDLISRLISLFGM